ncbi:MAG: hypothetical protein ABIS28_20605 [Caldimonas sp.]
MAWTGAASSPNWSAAANWNGGHPPVDGDGVVFGGAAGVATTVDLSASLDTLTFAAGAGSFQVHVAGGGGRTLSFGGLGIQNLTNGTGPIRQSLSADNGSSGGNIVFAATSGIDLGTGSSYRPVDLTALGGSATGQGRRPDRLSGSVVHRPQHVQRLACRRRERSRRESRRAAAGGLDHDPLRAEVSAARFTVRWLT